MIVTQSKTEGLSSARQEQEQDLFPFLHRYGGDKMMEEFVAVKRKKKREKKRRVRFFFIFIPKNKEDKENSEQA